MRKLLFLTLLLIAFPSFGQVAGIEFTPFVGYRTGGTFAREVTDLFGRDVKLDDSGTYGAALDIDVAPGVQLELMANHQETNFRTSGGLFEPDVPIADVSLTYYHVGALFQLETRSAQPFVVFGVGGTTINPDIPGADSENRLSGNLGVGVKVFPSPNIGLRLEGRGYWTSLDDRSSGCSRCYYDNRDDLYQFEGNVGVVFRF